MPSMKVVQFTNNDFDGGGRAVLRLHRGLCELGIDSKVVVLYKKTYDSNVFAVGNGRSPREEIKNLLTWEALKAPLFFRRIIKILKLAFIKYRLIFRWRPRSLFNFNIQVETYANLKKHFVGADVAILYGVQNMMSPEHISQIYKEFAMPIIFRHPDMEAMTGGCHFNFGCDKFTTTCGDCPQLGKASQSDISRVTLAKKKKCYSAIPAHVVSGNNFSLNLLRKSAVFHEHQSSVIFSGVEPERYAETDKLEARRCLQLPMDEKIILFGCFNLNDKRKGAHILKNAFKNHFIPLQNSDLNRNQVRLVTFGSMKNFSFKDLGFQWTHLGYVGSSEQMNLLYRASDVLVSPSIDDLGPMIVEEAFMNRLPIVSFDLGVAVDLVINGMNGYRVSCFDTEKLGNAIYSSLFLNVNANWKTNQTLQYLLDQCTLQSEALNFVSLIKKMCYQNDRTKSHY